jgi:hypothetical protein
MGLAPLHDGFDDIRGQIAKPQQPADMRILELEPLGDLGGVLVSPSRKPCIQVFARAIARISP